jgi:hypothetical protein
MIERNTQTIYIYQIDVLAHTNLREICNLEKNFNSALEKNLHNYSKLFFLDFEVLNHIIVKCL